MALSRFFRDSGHLIRPALVLLAGVVAFLILRAAVVPKSFGQYGHYRGDALGMIAARPISYAGRAQCAMCHEQEAKVHDAGKHAGVGCETCHGPQAKHVEAEGGNKPALPDVANLCRRCHEKDAAKPKGFPQVDTVAHSQGMLCDSCHQPHSPRL